jgi:hypothetical protein
MGHHLGLAGRLIAAIFSLGLAVVTLHLIENPLRLADPIRNSPLRSLLLGAVATVTAVGVCVALLVTAPAPVGRGAPAKAVTVTSAAALTSSGGGSDPYDEAVRNAFAQVQAAVAASDAVTAVPSNLEPPLVDASTELYDLFRNGCMLKVFEVAPPDCFSGDPTSKTLVALIGDSHAAMWAPAFQEVAKQNGWRLESLTKADCPAMDVFNSNPIRRVADSHCERWRTAAVARLRAERPRLTVISMWRGYGAGHNWVPGFTSYDSAWNDSLTQLVRQLRETGSQVLVLGPAPDPHGSVPICLSGHLDDATACSPSRSTAVNQTGIAAEDAAATAAGGQYVDVTDLFCTKERCPVVVGDTMVYFDINHLTPEYSRAMAPVMKALADRELAGP